MAERLPPKAAERFHRLLDAHETFGGAYGSAAEAYRDARATRERLDNRVREVERTEAGRHDAPGDPPYASPVGLAQQERDRAKAEEDRAMRRRDQIAAQRPADYRPLIDWVRALPPGTVIVDRQTPPPALPKGRSFTEAVGEARERVEQIRADIHQAEAAPLPSAIVKERARAEIAALAARGAPGVAAMVDYGERIRWPEAPVRMVGEVVVRGDAPDVLGLLAWLFKDQLAERLDELVDEASDDTSALSPADRNRRVAELQSELLEAERLEVALIDAAAEAGIPISYRRDVAPQALLAVSIGPEAQEVPAPPAPSGFRRLLPGRGKAQSAA